MISARWSPLPYSTKHHGITERIFLELISKGLCSRRSPDIGPSDFFLWDHLKGLVYGSNPHTIEDLKTKISSTSLGGDQTKMMV